MAKLRADGWVCYRAAGSHGCADIVAMKFGNRPRLVQVKASAQGAFEHFGPEDRQALIEEGFFADADPMLVWWPSGGELRYVPSDLWPGGRDLNARMRRLIEASGGDVNHALRVAQETERRTA
jgi:hypothetical protein